MLFENLKAYKLGKKPYEEYIFIYLSHLYTWTFDDMISYHQFSLPSASLGEIPIDLHFAKFEKNDCK